MEDEEYKSRVNKKEVRERNEKRGWLILSTPSELQTTL